MVALIVNILPSFSEDDGLTGYARTLEIAVRAHGGEESVFLVAGKGPAQGHQPAAVSSLQRQTASALEHGLWELLESAGTGSTLLLHYVGYGYARRGAPVWLLRGLRRLMAQKPLSSLIVWFHELYAFGPPWRSSFWMSPVQRWVARHLLELAEVAITNTSVTRRMLQGWERGTKPVELLHVLSNVGEPTMTAPLSSRARRIVVFGRAGTERRVYGRCRDELIATCRLFGVNEIVDIGRRLQGPPREVGGIAIMPMGMQTGTSVSAIMADSVAGFLDYPLPHVGKSGVLAAYCAHGLVPVLARSDLYDAEGLQEGQHFLNAQRLPGKMDDEELAAIAQMAFKWYHSHDASIHAERILASAASADLKGGSK